jgi:transposase
MGRSRGGLTTKIHALVDACGLPILLKLTEGQAHDGRSAEDMPGTLGRGDVLLADRAYDSDALRRIYEQQPRSDLRHTMRKDRQEAEATARAARQTDAP